MSRQKCLMVGAGHGPLKRKVEPLGALPDPEWVTLDVNPDVKPDVVFDLNNIEAIAPWYTGEGFQSNCLPFHNDTFDEIHCYEVMEHYGTQGDYRGFFQGMKEWWRILKPRGYLVGTVPMWNTVHAFGDPGHTRILSAYTFCFLNPDIYEKNWAEGRPMTDYRKFVDPCWWIVDGEDKEIHHVFGLQKLCPVA